MIKIEKTEVYGFEAAIRGMRNPLNSWDKSDSCYCSEIPDCTICELSNLDKGEICFNKFEYKDFYILGENDLRLAKQLANAGADHGKFLRQINVSVDITAPLYWWKEFDTYKVGTVANSCSTMHKIHANKFTMDDFSCEHLTEEGLSILQAVVNVLNAARISFIETKDKQWWWDMIQLLPTSYNQKRTVTLNYAVLRNIAHSRANHKLDEWSVGFMEWIKTLPYADELIFSK